MLLIPLSPSDAALQVLQGLETYITTEKFLHTLEAASAEWIDLSDHHQQPHKGWTPPNSSELELQQVGCRMPLRGSTLTAWCCCGGWRGCMGRSSNALVG